MCKKLLTVAVGTCAFGLGAILVQAAAPPAPQGVITAKVFLNAGSGIAVSDLTSNAQFPDNPDITAYPPYFELWPTGDIATTPGGDIYGNYGTQIQGYFYPDTTGDYIFYICSDDASELYLSADDNPAGKRLIAQEIGWSPVRWFSNVGGGGSTVDDKCSITFSATEWLERDANGKARISLIQGKAYYIEALQKESGGGDNLSVSIDGLLPIPGTMLSSFDKATGPAFVSKQPQSQTIVEGQPVGFTVEADGTPPYTYQWQRGGSDIADATSAVYSLATVSLSDDNAKFTVKVSNSLGSGTSQQATLTVTPDVTPPTLAKVYADATSTTITVQYSEPVSDGAASPASYGLDQGASITAVARVDAQTIKLTTSPLVGGTTYTLTINGVQDMAAAPNTIAANTKVEVRPFVFTPGMVIHQKYNGFDDATGNIVANLFNDPRYACAADRTDLVNMYEYPANALFRDETADPVRNYFDTITGVFIPPLSGNYVFFIAFADRCWLYLSEDETPANKHLIIHTWGWSDPRSWLSGHDYDPSLARSDSCPENAWPGGSTINLQAGKKYYLEMVHYDPSWAGGDWFAATYKLDTESDPADYTAPRLTGEAIGSYTLPPRSGDCPTGGPFLLNSGLQHVGPIEVTDNCGIPDAILDGTVDTSSVGPKSVVVQMTDTGGIVAERLCTYEVQYVPAGYLCGGVASHEVLPPIRTDGTSMFKKGSTIPVKFRVCDVQGSSIGPAPVVSSFVLYRKLLGGVEQIINEDIESTTPHTEFRWSEVDAQWIFNLSTTKLSVGYTYVYHINLNDGTYIDFQFELK